jgi:hypothetical protein
MRSVDRLLSRVQRDSESDCWIWTAGVTSNGYGRIRVGGADLRAHRHAYEVFVGPIPDGLVIDHLCRTPLCVNPSHLEPVTVRENTLRGVGRTARNAAKTHCLRGHEFTPENTYWYRGGRHCMECRRARKRLAA